MQFFRSAGKPIVYRMRRLREQSRRKRSELLPKFGMRFAQVRIGKIKLWVDLLDGLGKYLFVWRVYEPFETFLLEQVTRPGMTIVDVGANVGYYTIILGLKVGPKGKVIAFEPDPTNMEMLRRNVRSNRLSNVICEQAAALSSKGQTTLYLSKINNGDHRVFNAQDDDRFNNGFPRSEVSVKTIAIDEYLKESGLQADLVKMDVQGAEMLALPGMIDTLSNPDTIFFCEFWPYALRKAGSEPIEFLVSLKGLEFELFEIIETNRTVVPVDVLELSNRFEDSDYANLVCVHRSRKKDIPFLGISKE